MPVNGANGIAVLFLGGNVTQNVALVFSLIGFKVKTEVVLCPDAKHCQFILLVELHLVFELKIGIGGQERQPDSAEQELQV